MYSILHTICAIIDIHMPVPVVYCTKIYYVYFAWSFFSLPLYSIITKHPCGFEGFFRPTPGVVPFQWSQCQWCTAAFRSLARGGPAGDALRDEWVEFVQVKNLTLEMEMVM